MMTSTRWALGFWMVAAACAERTPGGEDVSISDGGDGGQMDSGNSVGDGGEQADAGGSDAGANMDAGEPDAGNGQGPDGGVARVNAVFPPLTENADFLSYVVASPWVDGINPPLAWSAVDFGPGADGGQYQWGAWQASVQSLLDAAQTNGKKINIIVYPIGYSASQAAPAYVLQNTALDKVTCAQQTNWPVVYEAPFKDAYKAFITEVIQHFSGNPLIGYIRFGLSRGGEVFPFCPQQEMALVGETNFQTWLQNDWAPYDQEMLDYELAQHPTMQIMSPTTQSGTPDVTIQESANAIADGFGFGCQGLEKSDIMGAPNNCTGDWCALFDQYAGQAPLELQTIGQSDAAGTLNDGSQQAATGPLPPLIQLGLQYHATTFEVYSDDLLLALDSNPSLNGGQGYCNNLNQCFGTYGAQYTAALKMAHGH
jgi:hypothetical protein